MTEELIPSLNLNSDPNYIENELKSINTDEIQLTETSTLEIPLLNIKVDTVSLYVNLGCIIVILLIWQSLGLFKMIVKDKFMLVLLILQIMFFIVHIFISPKQYANLPYENVKMTNVVQIGTVLLGSMILFAVFKSHFSTTENKLMMISIILNCLLYIFINVEYSASSVSIVRKVKQGILNITTFLFITVVYLNLSYSRSKK